LKKIGVLVVDDSESFARAAAAFVQQRPELEVLGIAGTGLEALERVRRQRPDLVLMDLKMPGMDGLEAIRKVKALPAAPKTIAMTLEDFPELQASAYAAGADAFLAKKDLGEKLHAAIDRLFEGRKS
jgi:two-component system nitrate/nitrite response regulator NarL